MIKNKNLEIFFGIENKESEYEQEKARKKTLLARCEFEKRGKYGIPMVHKQFIDGRKIDLICYTKAKTESFDIGKTVHFFTYDWKFEEVYAKPDIALEKIDHYYALLTPEFSMYYNMPLALKIYSVFKNRWCGAFWQNQGLKVIPTITWSEDSYDFCFEGIEKGCIVAVTTYTRGLEKDRFMPGYNLMLEKVEPSLIVCYGDPFDEMKGNILAFDPYNKKELIKKIGFAEFIKRCENGELYPEF